MTPQTIENAKEYIKRNEGCRLVVYRDVRGFHTYGWGHKVKGGENFTGIEFTQEFVDMVFETDFSHALYDFYQLKKCCCLNDIGEWRETALLDMIYQMGLRGVLGFKKTLHNLEYHSFALAAIEVLDSEYRRQTPARALRVSFIFKNNAYPPETMW